MHSQYPWHLSQAERIDVSVYIPWKGFIHGRRDLLSILAEIPIEVVVAKQKLIAKLAPRLQYSVPPHYMPGQSTTTAQQRWDPPFPDAMDAIVDGAISRAIDLVAKQKAVVVRDKKRQKKTSKLNDVFLDQDTIMY